MLEIIPSWVSAGGPTLGWLNQCAKGMARIWDQKLFNRISTPCLFVQAGRDEVVSPDAIERLAAAVPTATLICDCREVGA